MGAIHWLTAALCLPLAACGLPTRVLEPAPAAREVPGSIMGDAVAADAGVTVIARGDAWIGEPPTLVRHVTPIEVTLRNRGKTAVLVTYRQFVLDAHGRGHAVLSPFDGVPRPIRDPEFPMKGFRIAPQLAGYFPGRALAPALPGSAGASLTARMGPPTADMLRLALPEGVLEPGGEISGFLYFDKIRRDLGDAVFRAEFLAADGRERLGTVEIPFRFQPL